jgi:hypothetical protein
MLRKAFVILRVFASLWLFLNAIFKSPSIIKVMMHRITKRKSVRWRLKRHKQQQKLNRIIIAGYTIQFICLRTNC